MRAQESNGVQGGSKLQPDSKITVTPTGGTSGASGKQLTFNVGSRKSGHPIDILSYDCIPTVRFVSPNSGESGSIRRCINGTNCQDGELTNSNTVEVAGNC